MFVNLSYKADIPKIKSLNSKQLGIKVKWETMSTKIKKWRKENWKNHTFQHSIKKNLDSTKKSQKVIPQLGFEPTTAQL